MRGYIAAEIMSKAELVNALFDEGIAAIAEGKICVSEEVREMQALLMAAKLNDQRRLLNGLSKH
ncbi:MULTISPECIES: hypothetical protein [Enterococcus]|uniref:hypothetical protein n=1 Tax=Enterococcus TaxID=1350 RepID=UPI0003A0A80C|nr:MULTISPECIES: hypothetical protein [Enterococcus]MDN6003515.1 hypothetical protein [Enterococcus sp.]MDN6217134.1 hypothetical protein [Enterococcus sp.]MDN6561387.1 hypothetical protein [Enterococcus sp.]MDN6584807.1 hypothetical protein [Enterococcus sp.]MDN6753268.1 hypothetical protein [Enterococcus sp.]